jgi:hypothetical protein
MVSWQGSRGRYRADSALIDTHSEKQGFLKALYENSYKAYNRKQPTGLGVVHTPGEIESERDRVGARPAQGKTPRDPTIRDRFTS